MIKCICINNAKKPDQIPASHWLVYGKEYTVVMIYNRVQPGALLGVVLKEIDLDEIEVPFKCFQIARFGFEQKDLPVLEKLIRDCKGLQDFDPIALIKNEVNTHPIEDDICDEHPDDANIGDL